ncbi:MAG: tetratricopeptide repeat protein [Acidobacteria bacterium]|nr:tetratricopeptide repeat protein [Acidobacteriota bacterium]
MPDDQWTAAATRLSRAIDVLVAHRGPDHPLLVTPLISLGAVHLRAGRADLAVPLLERARALAAGAGPDAIDVDAHTIVQMLNTLGEAYRTLGHPDQAEPLYREALVRLEQDRGGDHPEAATILNNLARIHIGTGRLDEAEALLRRAAPIVEARAGEAAPALCLLLANLAYVLLRQTRLAPALPLAERALAIGEHTSGSDHPDTVFARYVLGSLLHDAGDLDAAEAHLRTALDAQRTLFGLNHAAVTATQARLDTLRHARQSAGGPAKPY